MNGEPSTQSFNAQEIPRRCHYCSTTRNIKTAGIHYAISLYPIKTTMAEDTANCAFANQKAYMR